MLKSDSDLIVDLEAVNSGGSETSEHWNSLTWYILGEVNTGCPSKVGSTLSDTGERDASVGVGGSVEF